MREASYEEFEASSLFCPHCRSAQPVRKKLLLVLPGGNKYDYICQGCNRTVGGKVDDNQEAFRHLSPKFHPPRRP